MNIRIYANNWLSADIAKAAAVACTGLIATAATAGAGIAFNQSDIIYPLVKVEGHKIGLTAQQQARAKLVSTLSNSLIKRIKYQDQITEISLTELGINPDWDATVDLAYNSGRHQNWLKQRDFSLQWQIDRVLLTDALNKIIGADIIAPQDAHIDFSNGKLQIKEGENGKAADIDSFISQFEDNLAINLLVKEVAPGINARQLNSALVEIEPSIIELNIVLNQNQKIISRDQVSQWLKIEKDGDIVKLTFDKDKIAQYSATLAKTTDIAMVADAIYSDGQLVSAGRDGIKLDQADLTEKIIAGLKSGETLIQGNLIAIAKGQKIVEKPFTPGAYEGKYVEIDLSSQQLAIFNGQDQLGAFKISSGKGGSTPTGVYHINGKNPRAYSGKYNLYMPYWMPFIGSKYGLHELPEWSNGKKEGESHLGTPVSHGCVRLGIGAAKTVYDFVDIGTVVYIHG